MRDCIEKKFEELKHPEWLMDALVSRVVDPSETVVITGFWRSGTTWLMESVARSMNAKDVFEPFHFSIPSYQDALSCTFYEDRGNDFLNLFMPMYFDDQSPHSPLKEYCRSALVSSIPGGKVRWPRYNRQLQRRNSKITTFYERLKNSIRTTVVTKFVRAHLLIPALHSWFDPVIIHVRRDPRAIISSFRRHDWTFHHSLSLERQLLNPSDTRCEYFKQWKDEIQRIDKLHPDVRLASYWALTDRFVKDLEPHSCRIIISYEELCFQGAEYLRSKFNSLDLNAPENKDLNVSSSTTYEDRKQSKVVDRLYSWKDELSESKISSINEIMDTFLVEPPKY